MNKPAEYHPLAKPIPLSEQKWPRDVNPVVTTFTVTFMHETFIKGCIEGILKQETTFPVQVLIHDDASTDQTTEILKEYEKNYPGLIKVYYQETNIYQRPDRAELMAEFYSWVRGKYIAPCDGDDYWTDPFKLQKQVEFLESDSNASGCFHNGQVFYSDRNVYQNFLGGVGSSGRSESCYRQLPSDKIFTENLFSLITYIPTASLMYRASCLPFEHLMHDWCTKSASTDIIIFSMLTKGGLYLKYLDFDGFVYRKHDSGVSLRYNSWSIYLSRKSMYLELSDFHEGKFQEAFTEMIRQHRMHGFRWLLANWGSLTESQIREASVEIGADPKSR